MQHNWRCLCRFDWWVAVVVGSVGSSKQPIQILCLCQVWPRVVINQIKANTEIRNNFKCVYRLCVNRKKYNNTLINKVDICSQWISGCVKSEEKRTTLERHQQLRCRLDTGEPLSFSSYTLPHSVHPNGLKIHSSSKVHIQGVQFSSTGTKRLVPTTAPQSSSADISVLYNLSVSGEWFFVAGRNLR